MCGASEQFILCFDSLQLQIGLPLEGDQSDSFAASLAKRLQLKDSYWCRGDISPPPRGEPWCQSLSGAKQKLSV